MSDTENDHEARSEYYYNELNKSLKELDAVLGRLDYLQHQIGLEVDSLTDIQGEVNERAEKIAQALDLNRKNK